MDTAVEHYLEESPSPTPLDKDRMRALAAFLGSAGFRGKKESVEPVGGLLRSTELDELMFAPHFILSQAAKDTPRLVAWRPHWKSGPGKRTTELAKFVRKYADAKDPSTVRTTAARDELQVVRALLETLIRQTEEAMLDASV